MLHNPGGFPGGFPAGAVVKNPPANAGDSRDVGSVPGLGRSLAEGKGYPLQYSSLENSIGCIVHGVAKSWTRLSDFHSLLDLKYSTAPDPSP